MPKCTENLIGFFWVHLDKRYRAKYAPDNRVDMQGCPVWRRTVVPSVADCEKLVLKIIPPGSILGTARRRLRRGMRRARERISEPCLFQIFFLPFLPSSSTLRPHPRPHSSLTPILVQVFPAYAQPSPLHCSENHSLALCRSREIDIIIIYICSCSILTIIIRFFFKYLIDLRRFTR